MNFVNSLAKNDQLLYSFESSITIIQQMTATIYILFLWSEKVETRSFFNFVFLHESSLCLIFCISRCEVHSWRMHMHPGWLIGHCLSWRRYIYSQVLHFSLNVVFISLISPCKASKNTQTSSNWPSFDISLVSPVRK